MSGKIEQIFTAGLTEGYVGNSKIKWIRRAGFVGKASNYPTEDGIYHDQWFTPNYLGGGQELAKVGDEAYTRLYGGGTPSPEELAELGLTVNDVGNYLKAKITELGGKTRLFLNCHPKPDGDWQYSYDIIRREPHIPVFLSEEKVIYQKTHTVHWHPIIISPIR